MVHDGGRRLRRSGQAHGGRPMPWRKILRGTDTKTTLPSDMQAGTTISSPVSGSTGKVVPPFSVPAGLATWTPLLATGAGGWSLEFVVSCADSARVSRRESAPCVSRTRSQQCP